MKRFLLLWACVGLFVLTGRAIAIGESVHNLNDVAAMVPDETALYLVVRTDDQVLKDLNQVLDRVTDKLAILGVDSIDLEDQLRTSLQQMDVDYDDLRAALGDYVAMTATLDTVKTLVRTPGQTPSGLSLYFQVADVKAMRRFVELNAKPLSKTQDGYQLYEPRGSQPFLYALSEDWLIITTATDLPAFRTSLAEEPVYKQLYSSLPADTYGGLLYGTAEALSISNQQSGVGVADLNNQPLLMAFGLEDQRNLILDIVQTLPQNSAVFAAIPYTPVDEAFLSYVPEDADLVLHINDLSGYFDYFDEYMRAFAGIGIRREVDRAFQDLDLNLDDDLLNWSGGNALLYSTLDLEALADIGMTNQIKEIPIEFGFVVETSDQAASERLLARLTQELKKNSSSVVRVGSAQVNNTDVTTLRFTIPYNGNTVKYDVMMGVTDDVFFIASAGAADYITGERETSLLDSAEYRKSSALYLPNTNQLWYASDEGALTIISTVAVLALMQSGMDIPGLPLPNLSAPSPYVSYQPGSTSYVFELARSLLGSSSITSARGDGVQITRLVFSLE